MSTSFPKISTIKSVDQAVNILMAGCQKGLKAGAYDLSDAAGIIDAIRFIAIQFDHANKRAAAPPAVAPPAPAVKEKKKVSIEEDIDFEEK